MYWSWWWKSYLEDDKIEETIDKSEKEKNKSKEDAVNLEEQEEILDKSDPANWKIIDQSLKDFLVRLGPLKRAHEDYVFPKNDHGRHFSRKYCKRELKNGDKQDRSWLLYWVISDKAYFFCCKLFGRDQEVNQFSSKGFNDWKNIWLRLSQNKTSYYHIVWS